MVFEEVKHVVADVVSLLPSSRDGMGGLMTTDDGANSIVHTHLIIEIIETRNKVVTVFGWVIHLTDEEHLGIAVLYFVGGPTPEFSRHHLCHITTEAIDAL